MLYRDVFACDIHERGVITAHYKRQLWVAESNNIVISPVPPSVSWQTESTATCWIIFFLAVLKSCYALISLIIKCCLLCLYHVGVELQSLCVQRHATKGCGVFCIFFFILSVCKVKPPLNSRRTYAVIGLQEQAIQFKFMDQLCHLNSSAFRWHEVASSVCSIIQTEVLQIHVWTQIFCANLHLENVNKQNLIISAFHCLGS